MPQVFIILFSCSYDDIVFRARGPCKQFRLQSETPLQAGTPATDINSGSPGGATRRKSSWTSNSHPINHLIYKY